MHSNKIWVNQSNEFYNNTFKDILKINNIEMCSTYNEGKSVVAERFIRTRKNNIFKHMTTILKNVYFEVLDDIVDKYNSKFLLKDMLQIGKKKFLSLVKLKIQFLGLMLLMT